MPQESLNPPLDGQPGDRHIGPYRRVREIGRGGQGAVYLAEDTRNGGTVALKVLTERSAISPQAIGRFRREAEITARLSHPGICPIYEVGLDADVPFIAMKLIDGETLATKITTAREDTPPDVSTHVFLPETSDDYALPVVETSRPPPSAGAIMQVVRLIEQAARAVHIAHEAGIIHRDINPGNMMVTPAGYPVILDFGLAEDLDSDAPTLTYSGDLLGTLHYM